MLGETATKIKKKHWGCVFNFIYWQDEVGFRVKIML